MSFERPLDKTAEQPSLDAPLDAASDERDERDEDVARILRTTGARRVPPPGMRERVYDEALATFDSLPASTSADRPAASNWARGRRTYAAAAGVLLAVLTGLLWQQQVQRVKQPVLAYVNYSRGEWQLGDNAGPGNLPITAGAPLRTSSNAALELQLIDGALLRVAPDTQLRLTANNRIELQRGRVFVDVHGRALPVHVLTPQGEVTDVGTEFEVQVARADVTVRVREGQVRLQHDHIQLTASARSGVGEMLRVDSQGDIHRSHIDTRDPYWDWLAGARPAYALDQGSLHDFLRWSASATGLSLRYQSEAVRQAAVATQTRGNIDGMHPKTAIDIVLATTRLQRVPAATYELLIDFARER